MATEEQIKRFRRVFRGRENSHGSYTPLPNGEKDAATLKGGIPDHKWVDHLTGEGPFLGSIPIMQDNTCYWGCIDYDDDAVDHFTLDNDIRQRKLPLLVIRSKSGGAHVYVFFSEPVPATLVIEKLKAWRTALGLVKNPDGRGVEIFPKQSNLRPSQQANWVNVPYYGGDESNRYLIYKGEKRSLDEFLAYAENYALSEAALRGTSDGGEDPFADGPPCMQTLHRAGWGEGSRNQSLFSIALMLRLMHPEDWKERAFAFNRAHFNPALRDREVEELCDSLDGHDYVYKCNDAPLESVCNKTLCYKRKWGIKAFHRQESEREFPEMTELVKILTDPPIWSVKVNGTSVELLTDDLLLLPRFRKVCLEKLSMIVPMLTAGAWEARVKDLLATRVEQIAPEDAGILGEFRALIGEFLKLRKSSRSKDDLLLGKPWEDAERKTVYFRSTDFTSFLKRKNFKDYSVSKIYSELKKMGADGSQLSVKGAKLKVWSLPAPDGEQKEDFDMPKSNTPRF